MFGWVLNTPLIKVRSVFTSLFVLTWSFVKYTLKPYAWHRDVVVITTLPIHSTKSELRLCADSNPARGVLEIYEGKNLRQWSWLEIRLNVFHRSTILQEQFIIVEISIKLETSKKPFAVQPVFETFS